jgi:hypothetical protein
MEKTEKGIGFLEKIMVLVDKYSIFQFIKGFFVLLITSMIIWFISNPTYIFEKYTEYSSKIHSERLETRMKNNERLHILSEKLLYKINADRVLILELHNGLSSNSGLPFAKCSATYEALNDGVQPISDQYQDVNLSLIPFATELFNKGYWCGDTEKLEMIDRGLTYKMLSNGTEHFAACVIEGIDKPLAFIFVSFKSKPDHDCRIVQENIHATALELALLLELNKR